jgi:hypothetical protein
MEEAENPVAIGQKVCRACSQWHHEKNYYYLFPEKVPNWFIERHHLRELVDQALKEDEALRKLVQKLKKTMNQKKKKEDQEKKKEN